MNWKIILFDFDDTLYLKTIYDFVPGIQTFLQYLRQKNLIIGILTYNPKSTLILESYGLDKYFNFIKIINKSDKKSTIFKNDLHYLQILNKKEILFFDNDPFNIYDMSRLGICCFLVNPINGISKDTINDILQYNFKKLYKNILDKLSHSYNYVERTTLTQNLEQLEYLISQM